QDGLLTEAEHEKAVKTFSDYMQGVRPSPQGDIRFILRNEEIRKGYSCLHSADAYYIALAEDLAKSLPAEFLTFDRRVINVIANKARSVKVNLRPSYRRPCQRRPLFVAHIRHKRKIVL